MLQVGKDGRDLIKYGQEEQVVSNQIAIQHKLQMNY